MKKQIKRIGIMLVPLLFFTWLTGHTQQVTITPAVTPTCTGTDGAVTFTITGGHLSPTDYYNLYSTSTGMTYPQQTTPTFTGLTTGSYYMYITGSDSGSVNFTISAKVQLTSSATNTTCPVNAGTATVVASGGTGGYSYIWSNGGTTATISSLPGGLYQVTVTDGSGCTAMAQDTVLAPSSMSVGITNNGVICNQTLTALATGNTGAVSYVWNTGANTAAISGLSNYTYYTVTATDSRSCTASQVSYVAATTLTVDSGAQVVNASCTANNGSVEVHTTNGTAPFSFLWSNGATDSIITGLGSGQYVVTVTDANGCADSFTYYVNQSTVNAYAYVNQAPDCGSSDGIAEAYAYGGSGTYSYLWSLGGSTTSENNNLAAGTYSVTVNDGTGCSATASVVLTGVANYTASITESPTACDTSLYTGSATAYISGTGGTPPYAFSWYENFYSNSTTALIGTSQTVTGLSYGEMVTLSVTDAAGCVPTVTGNDSLAIQLDPNCFDHISGYAFYDSNGNCIRDAGEQGLNSYYVVATSANGGQTYYGNPDNTGFYDIEVGTGIYNVSLSSFSNSVCAHTVCVSTYYDSFTVAGQVSTNNFAVGGTAAYDLGVHMGDQGSAPGQQREYWVYYYNHGQSSVANGVLTFTYDTTITFASATPTPTSVNTTTNTSTWNITNNLDPIQGIDSLHQVVLYFNIPASQPLGTIITTEASISPTVDDCNPADNSQVLADIVSGSHDPNSKSVSPAGNLTAADTVLTYTIRFENDGNAPASEIVIKDTLSANVDPRSVVPGASSHPYTFSITGQGVLTFTFQNINLPDTSHGISSQGFVMYTVQTIKDLPLYSQVNNTASIYFDQNPAVVSNTTQSLRSDFPTGISTISSSSSTMTAQVVPNPVHDNTLIKFSGATGAIKLMVTDELGNQIITTSVSGSSYALDAQQLSSGIYFYTAKDAVGNRASGKISVVR